MTKFLSDELIVKVESHSYTQSAQICYLLYLGQALCRRHKASGLHHLAVPYFDFIDAIRYVGRRSNLSPTLNAGRFVRFSHDCFC